AEFNDSAEQAYKVTDSGNRNPMDRFRNLPINTREPKPFTASEMEGILNQLQGQERNLIQFAFWTGLRTSELIALRWEDFDSSNKRIYVRTAVVRSKEKGTKTHSGHRTVELSTQALAAIEAQKQFTTDSLRIFHDPKNGVPWHDDQAIRKRVWTPALVAAGIEYRSPYQTRHTFASMMLSSGKNPLWVAQQMGHKDWGMIRKVYGRWIPVETNYS
ncbi:MAG: site-specific integrase, partial [Motiliproteus sp.]